MIFVILFHNIFMSLTCFLYSSPLLSNTVVSKSLIVFYKVEKWFVSINEFKVALRQSVAMAKGHRAQWVPFNRVSNHGMQTFSDVISLSIHMNG